MGWADLPGFCLSNLESHGLALWNAVKERFSFPMQIAISDLFVMKS